MQEIPTFPNPPQLDPSQWFALDDFRQLAGRLPDHGGLISFVTYRALTAPDLLALLLGCGACDRALLCSFNVSEEAAGFLDGMVTEGRIDLLDVIVSNSMPRLQAGGALPVLEAMTERLPNRVRLRLADVHAKVYCLAMASGDNWVVETSANLARNSRIELFTIWNSAERLFWHAEWTAALVR